MFDNVGKDDAKLAIDCLQRLLQAYSAKDSRRFLQCPLCALDSYLGSENCKMCPWTWFTHKRCTEWNEERGYRVSYKEKIAVPSERYARMKQIRRWIAKLEQYTKQ